MKPLLPHDLTRRPPRSARARLGGFAHLPRLLDKARAAHAATLGNYVYGDESLLDREFFRFTGITAESLLRRVAGGDGDLEILEWIQSTSGHPPQPHEIEGWSRWIENVPGLSREARAWFADYSGQLDPPRPDVSTLFEYLDLDDHLSFGGRA